MKLQTLDLTNYIQITDAAMQYIGQIQTLRKLRLSNTKISDSGLVFLEGWSLKPQSHVKLSTNGMKMFSSFP